MHRYVGLSLIWTVVAAMTPSNLSAADPERAVDIGSFLKELMVLRVTGHNIHLAYWYPNEFLTEVLVAEGNTRAVAESNAAVFRPYLALIVHQSNEGTDGVVRHASSESLRARAGLRSDDGDEVKPLEVVPALVGAYCNAIKTALSEQKGAISENLHILLFPAKTADGTSLIDPAKKSKLTLHLTKDDSFEGAKFVWRTPFDAVTPSEPCAKCREAISAKWTFCPWCGGKLGTGKSTQ